MMIKINISLLLFACLLIFACDQENHSPLTPIYEEGTVFSHRFNETSNCSCEDGPEISFTQLIEESRCPTNVDCIVAGQVIVNIKVNEENIELGLSTFPDVTAVDTVGVWSIELIEVRPYPQNADAYPNQEDYELDLVLRRI